MGRRPSKMHSIDRIDNDGDYTPLNCRWATYSEQNKNRRFKKKIEYKGKCQNLTQWSIELGVSYHRLYQRLALGWPIDKAFSVDRQKSGRIK